MLELFLLATVVKGCPVPGPDACDLIQQGFEAHQVVTWEAPLTPWPCDGSVWWVVTIDGDNIVKECVPKPMPGGDTIIYCEDSVSPLKHWDGVPGEEDWMHVYACNDIGCSPGCSIQIVWPSYVVLP